MDIKADNVIRINVAWVKDREEMESYLDIPYSVFVDYPDGRKKPPVPTLSMDQIIDIISRHKNVKFFAISNAEDYDRIRSIKNKLMVLNTETILVPKIETRKGIKNIDAIISASASNYVMLDKEDLYVDVRQNKEEYLELKRELRERCKEINVHIFELAGVIFDDGNQTK